MVERGTNPERLTRELALGEGNILAQYHSVLLIMLTGFVILRAALSNKYGINPWMRLSPENVSEASSEATKV